MQNRINRTYQFLKQRMSDRQQLVRIAQSKLGVGMATLAVFSLLGVGLMMQTRAATLDSFVFGTGGDHSSGTAMEGVFRGVGAHNPDFFLTLGDMSYDTITPAAWCQKVKDNINIGAGKPQGDIYGETFPFPITFGNHEDSNIGEYLLPSCLPDRMNSVARTGSSYGHDYYFDYPTGSATPLARFIVMAPDLDYTFTVGSAPAIWLGNTIDQARAAGIKWIILSNHKNYISVSEHGDEIGSAYFNFAVSKKVDLMLQGHEHAYMRSHQLAHGTGCTTVPKDSANTACIVGDGSAGQYVKDKGMVLLISGTSGKDGRDVDLSNPEMPYFAKAAGSDADSPYGFNKITVTPDSLQASYINTSGAALSDEFAITVSGTTPTPPPAPTPAPTPPPTTITQTYNPVEDTTIASSSPTTNYGLSKSLEVDNSPVKHSLMKFTVANATGYTVKSAKLRLYVTNSSSVGGRLFRTANTAWNERTVTWNTAPVADTTPFATIGSASSGRWMEVDAMPLVQAGNGTYSVRMTSSSSDGVAYNSREASSNKPQLVLVLESAVPQEPDTEAPTAPQNLAATAASSSRINLTWTASTDNRSVAGYKISRNGTDLGVTATGTTYADNGLAASTVYTYVVTAIDGAANASPPSNEATAITPVTPPAPAVLTFLPTDDATIKQGSSTSNYGTSSGLDTDTSGIEQTLMKFTISGSNGRTVVGAKLRLYVTNSSPAGGNFFPVTNTTWSEKTVTYATAPVAGTVLITSLGAVASGNTIEADLSSYIKGDGVYSLRIVGGSSDGATYSSKEASTNKPQLVVTYQ